LRGSSAKGASKRALGLHAPMALPLGDDASRALVMSSSRPQGRAEAGIAPLARTLRVIPRFIRV